MRNPGPREVGAIAEVRRLSQKLQRIDALLDGATTEGERIAAARARERIQRRLAEALRAAIPPHELRFTFADVWSARVFIALADRDGLHPHRRRGQHRTTVMLWATPAYVNETLWPEFQRLNHWLQCGLAEVTASIVAQAFPEGSAES